MTTRATCIKDMISQLLVASLVVLLAGCEGSGADSHMQGKLLTNAGLGGAADVKKVLLTGGSVTDAAMIAQLYGAVDNPDRDWITKMARNRQIAFIAADGRVACLAYSEGGDLTEYQGSNTLMNLLRKVYNTPACRQVGFVQLGKLDHVRVVPTGTMAVINESTKQWDSLQEPLSKLVGLWNPDDVRGCERVSKDRVASLSNSYVEMKLARPITFETILFRRGFSWWPPPEGVYTRARYESIRSGLIRALSTGKVEMRLAFAINGSQDWILTSPISTRTFRGYDKAGKALFGPDLFIKVLSMANR